VRLTCSPTEFSTLAAIAQAYPDADLKGAMLAFWRDKCPHNIGIFKARLPDLLAAVQAEMTPERVEAHIAKRMKEWGIA
jgi:hypothetical protein